MAVTIFDSSIMDAEKIKSLKHVLDVGKGELIIGFADVRHYRASHVRYRLVETGNLKDCLFLAGERTKLILTDAGELVSWHEDADGEYQYFLRRVKTEAPRDFLSKLACAYRENTFGNSFIIQYTDQLGPEVEQRLRYQSAA